MKGRYGVAAIIAAVLVGGGMTWGSTDANAWHVVRR
jgi:hypothetical protein